MTRLGVMIVLLAVVGPASAQQVEQVISLHPGWNAIHLEVQPETLDAGTGEPRPSTPGEVFGALPVESVWLHAPQLGGAAFISTPGIDDLLDSSDWLGWFASPEKSLLNTLDEVQVNRSYLVKLAGSQMKVLTLQGRPKLGRFDWAPDAFTLTGFPVEAGSVTFEDFFAGSAEHAEAVEDGLIYELAGSGVWEPVLGGFIEPARAYWVFTRGGSQHQGPIEVAPLAGGGLDFGTILDEQEIVVRKRSGAGQVSFVLQPDADASASPVPLKCRMVAPVLVQGATEETCALTWQDFDAPVFLPSAPCGTSDPAPAFDPGQKVALTLGVARSGLPGFPEVGTSVLEVSDGSGVRWRLPVSAARESLAGLWVGEVTIDRVSPSTPPIEDLSFDLQLRALRDGIDPDTNQPIVEAERILVSARSDWQYDATGTDLNQLILDNPGNATKDWRRPEHPALGPAGAPTEGPAEFGFGDGDPGGASGTPLPELQANPQALDLACGAGPNQGDVCTAEGEDLAACGCLTPDGSEGCTEAFTCVASGLGRTPPAYFRTSFQFDPDEAFPNGASDVDRLVLNLLLDDGAIVHLNGEEVLRVNMPPRPESLAGEPTAVEPSHALRPINGVQGNAEAFFVEQPAARSAQQALRTKLVPGTNWIAVEVHQREFARPLPEDVDPTPVERPFNLRLIVHYDGSQARLLKEAIQMRDPDSLDPVLLTRDELIPAFAPATLVDGRPVGFRVSSAAFDFDCAEPDATTRYSAGCDAARNAIDLTGTGVFGDAGAVLGLILDEPSDAPTNPFVHRYHPDHDNLDAEFAAPRVEALSPRREITLSFEAEDPNLADLADAAERARNLPPDWGSDVLGGRYEETLSNLHRTPIRVQGTFRLRRASTAATIAEVAP